MFLTKKSFSFCMVITLLICPASTSPWFWKYGPTGVAVISGSTAGAVLGKKVAKSYNSEKKNKRHETIGATIGAGVGAVLGAMFSYLFLLHKYTPKKAPQNQTSTAPSSLNSNSMPSDDEQNSTPTQENQPADNTVPSDLNPHQEQSDDELRLDQEVQADDDADTAASSAPSVSPVTSGNSDSAEKVSTIAELGLPCVLEDQGAVAQFTTQSEVNQLKEELNAWARGEDSLMSPEDVIALFNRFKEMVEELYQYRANKYPDSLSRATGNVVAEFDVDAIQNQTKVNDFVRRIIRQLDAESREWTEYTRVHGVQPDVTSAIGSLKKEAERLRQDAHLRKHMHDTLSRRQGRALASARNF